MDRLGQEVKIKINALLRLGGTETQLFGDRALWSLPEQRSGP